ncbi:hypothetical protein NW762_014743 [Fusarium torreyae]|uniref:Zn(2)-C6 fungal-type domain-containing protein n=1 Tax=Fusarium torreyae TaxID=1237075 RepID=A0A9W8V7K0_9HYPO|nr:hypothetical protein NW762_014743 [Fusarium torreyae]
MAPPSRAVSCEFCRLRKLKCNRQFPCSNCLSRGVACPSLRTSSKDQPKVVDSSNDAILSRLDKIEAHLASIANSPTAKGPSSGDVLTVALTTDINPENHQQLPPVLQKLTEDAFTINRSLFRNNCATPIHDVSVRKCPIGLQPSLDAQFKDHVACVWFPANEEAEVLVNKYIEELNSMSCIIHGSSLKKQLIEAYNCGPQISAGPVVLLLAIFAFVARTWTHDDGDLVQLFPSYALAQTQANSWTVAAFDILEQCHRNSEVSLELAQGLSFLNLATFYFDGLTSHGSTTLAQTIAMCRQLGLHRIDHPSDKAHPQDNSGLYGVKAEIGRRIWWRLVTLDWMLATCPGPQRGTYSINPLHMAVKQPLNLDDEDLTDANDLSGRAPGEPTSMLCFLERIKLAEKMRIAIDKNPLTAIASSSGYQQALEIDAAISSFLQDLPHYALPETKDQTAPFDPRSSHMVKTSVQRHSLHSLLHGQRCRLHLPYLVRSAVEPSYGYSRRVALESARSIIDAEASLKAYSHDMSSARTMLGSVLFSYFCAVAVLALDMCLAMQDEVKVKKHEFEQAWCILEEARVRVSMIAEGMQILEATMRKHEVWPLAETQQHHAKISGCGPTANPNPAIQQGFVPFPPDLEGHVRQLDDMDWDVLRWVVDVPFL